MAAAERTERLLNLVIALLSTRRRLRKDQIRQAVPQYAAAATDEAFDRMFERDKEELRVAARVKFARYWSVFGATVLDLTNRDEDPFSLADGFEPVRHRLGLAYEDDCLELGVTWRRDYERLGEFRKGSTFALQIGLKGLGR